MPAPSLRLLVLKTRDVARLASFYRALGLDLAEERHGDGPLHLAGRLGDATFEIYPLPSGAAEPDATTRLGFAVDDLVATLDALRSLDALVASPPKPSPWGLRAVVRDPDGRSVELYEGRRTPGS